MPIRTYIYVDGFNVYYRALRGTKFKWLNLPALASGLMSSDNLIQQTRYFTAPVSGKLDPGQPQRQQTYLRALQTVPNLTIHLGSFLTKTKLRPLAHPMTGGPTHVEVLNSEEKGSDVNLASYLIHDAWRDLFDVALIFSQDTDLLEPVRIVKEEIGKPVGVVVLDGLQPGRLAKAGSFQRQITPARLAAAQLPQSILLPNGKLISCPPSWA